MSMESSEPFLKAASIIPHVACLLSVLGTAAIIFDIARRYRRPSASNPRVSDARSKPSTYHRLMVSLLFAPKILQHVFAIEV